MHTLDVVASRFWSGLIYLNAVVPATKNGMLQKICHKFAVVAMCTDVSAGKGNLSVVGKHVDQLPVLTALCCRVNKMLILA